MPLSGGDRPIGLVALSSLNENPGGDEFVIHRLVEGIPDFLIQEPAAGRRRPRKKK